MFCKVLFPRGSLLNVCADGRGYTLLWFLLLWCCYIEFSPPKIVACVFRSRTAVAPLERLKILLQVRSSDVFVSLHIFHSHPLECDIRWNVYSQVNFALMKSYNLQVQNPHNINYKGTIQGLKYIWRTEGFRGLFKGNGTNCARIVPNSAVKFFSYEQASKYDSLISLVVERHIFYNL